MAPRRQKTPAAGWKRTDDRPDSDPVAALDVAEYRAEMWRMEDALRGGMEERK